MSEETGFHPIAVEWTTDEARAGRDEIDRAAANPAVRERPSVRARGAASPERLAILNESLHRVYAAFTRGDFELNTLSMHPANYVFAAGGELARPPRRADAARAGSRATSTGLLEFQAAWDQSHASRSDAVADAGPGQIFNWARFQLARLRERRRARAADRRAVHLGGRLGASASSTGGTATPEPAPPGWTRRRSSLQLASRQAASAGCGSGRTITVSTIGSTSLAGIPTSSAWARTASASEAS